MPLFWFPSKLVHTPLRLTSSVMLISVRFKVWPIYFCLLTFYRSQLFCRLICLVCNKKSIEFAIEDKSPIFDFDGVVLSGKKTRLHVQLGKPKILGPQFSNSNPESGPIFGCVPSMRSLCQRFTTSLPEA